MIICCTGRHHVSECGNCGQLFISDKEPGEAITDLDGQYEQHLDNTPACKEWHDNLPTWGDIFGIDREESDAL
jgi:hypothetical protein